MADVTIRLAADDSDIEIARSLCWDWYEWHWSVFPPDWTKDNNPLDLKKYTAVVDDLPNLHARPLGGILLAFLGDQPVGCVMFSEQATGVAEFFRMFVRQDGRGYGIGRKLLESMFEQMRKDGYKKVVFSSAIFLTHAKTMYENAGFTSVPIPDSVPVNLRDRVYFMERSLN